MTYIDNMTESERYVYGFLVSGADEYVENEHHDTTNLTFRFVARCEGDEGRYLFVMRQCRCGKGWSVSVDAFNDHDDEPDSVMVDGWCGERIDRKLYATRSWWSFKDMACEVYDLMYDLGYDNVEIGAWNRSA